MKQVWIIALGVVISSVAGVFAADTPAAFRAGAAKANITPPLGSVLIGEWVTPPAQYVHDELWARCMVLDNGKTRVAFVVCDLLGLARCVSEEARRLVQAETGLPASHVLVSGTHTHSAPSALGERFSSNPVLNDYQKFVARRIADGVRCAINNLAPARIGWTSASEPRHVFCRRWFMKPGTVPANPFGNTNDRVKTNPGRLNPNLDKPAGPTDPEISLLAVQSLEGRPLALLANYSLHYVGGTRRAEVSADYYGMYNVRIQQLLDADRQDPPFVSLMSNGTSGNINNVDFSKPAPNCPSYGRMRDVANDIAQKVHAAYQAIQWRDSVPLAAAYEEIELNFRRPTPEQLEWAKGVLAENQSETKSNPHEKIYAKRAIEMNALPEHIKFPLQAFRIGDVGIATFPNEVFSEIGLEIKARSPLRPAFVVSLAHGYYGYLPTVEQHKLGGYETWLGTNQLEIEAAPKMVQTLLEMLARLKK